MSHQAQLTDEAERLATNASGRAAAIEHELTQIEARKRELEAQLHAAHLAHQRFSKFVPVRGSDLQCPRCWIEKETFAILRPIGGGSSRADKFRCTNCYHEMTLLV